MAEHTPYLFRPLVEHPAASVPSLSHRELLGRRLVLSARVRFVVAATFVLLPWAAALVDVLDPGRALILGVMGLLMAFYNGAFYAHALRHQDPRRSAAAFEALRLIMFTGILVDFLVLAVVVALFGGVRGPFTTFYLLHVVLSCLMLSRRVAIGFTGVALLLVAFQAGAELAGVVPGRLGRALPPLDVTTAALTVAIYAALFALTDLLLISLVEWLRRSERELREGNRRLERLSRLRRDFLHVAVHNLRAPVGATQMHLENLVAGLAGPVTDKQRDWLLRIGHRLEGLQEMLQDLSLLGELETQDVDASASEVSMEEVLRDVVEEYDDQARMAGLSLVVEAEGAPPRVRGIRRLLREAVVNFVTNAIKYAPGSGPVVLSVRPLPVEDETWVRVAVRDRGPGVAEEKRARLFQEFVRPTPLDEPPETPWGSGLGLSLVRRIAEAHGGRVGATSRPGEGSEFWVELPGL